MSELCLIYVSDVKYYCGRSLSLEGDTAVVTHKVLRRAEHIPNGDQGFMSVAKR